jgi:putative membrane protein
MRMRRMALRFLACVGAVPLCVYLLPGVTASNYTYAVIAGAVLGVIYITLRPVAKLLLGVFNIFTLGLLYVLLDAWLVQLCSWVMLDDFHVDSFLWALATALIVNAARSLFGNLFKPAK